MTQRPQTPAGLVGHWSAGGCAQPDFDLGVQPARLRVLPARRLFDEQRSVGLQVGREPVELVGADAPEPQWDFDIEAVIRDGQHDFRGSAVHGKRGDRLVYLTWGEVSQEGGFEMFRRAKLMLNRIEE